MTRHGIPDAVGTRLLTGAGGRAGGGQTGRGAHRNKQHHCLSKIEGSMWVELPKRSTVADLISPDNLT